jgi:DNA-binding LacI/PurR family transcriptional regulator
MDQRPKPTIKHVARVAGVSVATVSRVTSGLTVVSEPTKRRVEEAIASVGYKPNLAAVDMSRLASNARRLNKKHS